MPFLPITREEMKERGIEQFDFVYVIGDAYVDHSSFGPAIISRVLEANGYSVGIISQPDWKDENSISIFGEPRLGFLVSSGNMDSMVNHYTVAKKHRKTDAFTPGGVMGKRPDRAVTVYGNLIRRTYKHTPMILGGIEASLRRLSHYDYWSDQVRRSVLLDSGADLISYGMGELSIVAIADALAAGIDVHDITFIPGTVYRSKTLDHLIDPVVLPSFEEVRESKRTYAESFAIQYKNTDAINAKPMAEPYEGQGYIVQNPPSRPLTEQEMDDVYALPYMRAYHPSYEKDGGVPALGEIKYSLTSNRGCFGSCSFCALTFHEGRVVQTRSHESILAEARQMVQEKEFKGYIHDVGGPTANFRHPSCQKQLTAGVCRNRHCVGSEMCPNLDTSHADYLELLREIRKLPGVKKVFVRSGLRYDYVLADNNHKFVEELCRYHVSGQLKVAPEHVVKHVTDLMGKADVQAFLTFKKWFDEANEKIGKKQYLVPYFMSSHPGCTLKDAVALAEFLRDMHMQPEQVQDFIPTPGSLSTAMYYTGINPLTGEKVYVARRPEDKQMQRALMQYKNPANYDIVHKALCLCGRRDLIGYGPKCLIPPRRPGKRSEQGSRGRRPAAAAAKARPGRRAAGVPGNHDARRGPGKKARTNHSAFR